MSLPETREMKTSFASTGGRTSESIVRYSVHIVVCNIIKFQVQT